MGEFFSPLEECMHAAKVEKSSVEIGPEHRREFPITSVEFQCSPALKLKNMNFPAFLERFRMPILFMTNTLTR